MKLDIATLATQWIAEKRRELEAGRDDMSTEWRATDVVLHLPYDSISDAWAFIEEVLRQTSSMDVLALLGASMLEELIAVDHSHAVEKLRELISRYPVVGQLLHCVWQNATPDPVWQKVLLLRS
jgi:hypothetical protein